VEEDEDDGEDEVVHFSFVVIVLQLACAKQRKT